MLGITSRLGWIANPPGLHNPGFPTGVSLPDEPHLSAEGRNHSLKLQTQTDAKLNRGSMGVIQIAGQ